MNRLNYFNPYQSRPDDHEDQLTRAFLVLMRYSFAVLSGFYDQCLFTYGINLDAPEPILPGFTDLLDGEHQFETQRSNPTIQTNYLLSVLITDNAPTTHSTTVNVSERNARYDGILTFANELTIIIENKPRSAQVWFDQLNPSRQNLSDETHILQVPVLLSWHGIIQWLTKLLTVPSIAGAERLLIDDFLGYVDARYPHLNPYHRLDLCKGNEELIKRRIKTLLESIAIDPNLVKYHRGWGYYIETPYSAIKKVGLIYWETNGRWWLELSLYAGDTVNQARTLYKQTLQTDKLALGWTIRTNYHVSFQASNLVWFPSSDAQAYIAHWQTHPDQIRQLKRNEVDTYLANLVRQGIIQNDSTTQHLLSHKFTHTNMTTLNSCPGIGLFYTLEGTQAEMLDRTDQLGKHIQQRIVEGLAYLGLPDLISEQSILTT